MDHFQAVSLLDIVHAMTYSKLCFLGKILSPCKCLHLVWLGKSRAWYLLQAQAFSPYFIIGRDEQNVQIIVL